jgi:hypothetical protein
MDFWNHRKGGMVFLLSPLQWYVRGCISLKKYKTQGKKEVAWVWRNIKLKANLICFMCFWFGLEILRLVYKKSVFWNIEQFLSYFTFYPPKKCSAAPFKSWKKILPNWLYRISNEAKFCADFSVHKSWVWQKVKIFDRKTEFLGTWKIL